MSKPKSKKPTRRTSILLSIGFLLGILVTVLFVQATTPPPYTFTISSGVYSSAPAKYTVWAEGGYYYAKDAYGLQPVWSGSTNASYVINTALSFGGQTVLGEGTFYLDPSASIEVTIKGTVLRGAGRYLTFINMTSTTKDAIDIQIDSCKLSDFAVNGGRDNIHIAFPAGPTQTIYADIYSNILAFNASRYGFYTERPDGTLFQSCWVIGAGEDGFFLNGTYLGSVSVALRDCRTSLLLNGYAVDAEHIAYLTIDGGELNAEYGGFKGYVIQGAIITGVNFEEMPGGTTYYCMRFDGTVGVSSHDVVIEGNHFRYGIRGIYLDYANDFTIQNNWFEDFSSWDIQVENNTNVHNIIFQGNSIDKPSTWNDAKNITVLNKEGLNTESSITAENVTASTFVFNHGLIDAATNVQCSFNFTGWTSWTWTSTATDVTVTVTGSLPAAMTCYAKVEYQP